MKVAIEGWRKKMGAGRVIYLEFGINMLTAQLTKDAAKTEGVINGFEEKEDDMTGLKWQRVETELWTDAEYLITEQQPLWDYAAIPLEAAVVFVIPNQMRLTLTPTHGQVCSKA